jgi:hypothetical protein
MQIRQFRLCTFLKFGYWLFEFCFRWYLFLLTRLQWQLHSFGPFEAAITNYTFRVSRFR